jgi:hypothetical protein
VGAFALVLATTQWWGWEAAMRQGLDTDVGSYQQIARAAPQLPSQDLPQQHAERFAPHWLVGVLSNESMLHAAYYVAAILALAAIVAVFHVHAARTGAALNAYLPALLVLVASPYLFRLDALGPGLVADAVFALGLAGLVAGLAARDDATALAALAVASAARQTAVPVGLVAAAVVLLRSRRAGRAAAFALVPLAIYGVEHAVAASFSKPVPGAWEISVLADPGGVRPVAKHVLLIVLPLLPALALLAGGSLRHGVPRDRARRGGRRPAATPEPVMVEPERAAPRVALAARPRCGRARDPAMRRPYRSPVRGRLRGDLRCLVPPPDGDRAADARSIRRTGCRRIRRDRGGDRYWRSRSFASSGARRCASAPFWSRGSAVASGEEPSRSREQTGSALVAVSRHTLRDLTWTGPAERPSSAACLEIDGAS